MNYDFMNFSIIFNKQNKPISMTYKKTSDFSISMSMPNQKT